MTHISLRDKESESSPRMTESESLDSARRVVPEVFKRVAGHSYAEEPDIQTGWSSFLGRPLQAPSLAPVLQGCRQDTFSSLHYGEPRVLFFL